MTFLVQDKKTETRGKWFYDDELGKPTSSGLLQKNNVTIESVNLSSCTTAVVPVPIACNEIVVTMEAVTIDPEGLQMVRLCRIHWKFQQIQSALAYERLPVRVIKDLGWTIWIPGYTMAEAVQGLRKTGRAVVLLVMVQQVRFSVSPTLGWKSSKNWVSKIATRHSIVQPRNIICVANCVLA